MTKIKAVAEVVSAVTPAVITEAVVKAANEAIPQLTVEQKLQIRDVQFSVLNLREQARQLAERADQHDQQLMAHLNGLAAALKIDVKRVRFDIATLTFQLMA